MKLCVSVHFPEKGPPYDFCLLFVVQSHRPDIPVKFPWPSFRNLSVISQVNGTSCLLILTMKVRARAPHR